MSHGSTDDAVLRPRTARKLRECFARLSDAQKELAKRPLAELLDVLESLGRFWQPGTTYYERAIGMLTGGLSRRAVEAALAGLSMGMTPAFVTAGLRRELGRIDLLETWQADEIGIGHVRGYPLGVVAQILAGNVFLGGVIAMSQSLLTRNAVLIKLSREDSGFTALFAEALREADRSGVVSAALAVCAWESKAEDLNEVVRAEADGVVVWGGAAAVAAYPAERCRGRVIHYGPRLGIALVLNGADLENDLPALAWDVALWEQQACSSPRLVLVEDADNSLALPRRVAQGLDRALKEMHTHIPARQLSIDEKAEVLSLRELAWWGEQAEICSADGAMDHTILLARQPPDEVPIGYRTVIVIVVSSLRQLPELVAPFRAWLQTAVLAAPADRWPSAIDALVEAGATEVVAAGAAAARFLGLPHEGEFALRRLVRLVGVDLGVGPLVYPDRSPPAALSSILTAGQ